MKKMLLVLFGLLVVLIFVVGCAPSTGEAVRRSASGSTCKLFSVTEYPWILSNNPTASSVCEKEGMSCGGVFASYKEEFLDSINNKVQAVNTQTQWLSTKYCTVNLGKEIPVQVPPNSARDYAEPYAGNVTVTTRYDGVLCCS